MKDLKKSAKEYEEAGDKAYANAVEVHKEAREERREALILYRKANGLPTEDTDERTWN